MITLGFNGRYRALHLSNEFGNSIIGGVCTHVQEQYRYHTPDIGFLHYRNNLEFGVNEYDDQRDIAIVTKDDPQRLPLLDFDILVNHFYDLVHMVTPELLRTRKMVYIVHSVPTPEPVPKQHAFGGHFDVEKKFKALCEHSAAVVTVSRCELAKLNSICPEFSGKASFIYNGLTVPETIEPAVPSEKRKRLGFIARMDYRKGLLELLKAIRHLDIELHIACDPWARRELHVVNEYIAAADIGDKLHWYGFCVGARKRAFFEFCDAIVVPSLYEPFCYTVIEPIAVGKPVIVANNSGPREIVGDDYAYQFEPYSVDDTMAALQRFMDDPVEKVMDEERKLINRMPIFDGRTMVEKYRTLLNAL